MPKFTVTLNIEVDKGSFGMGMVTQTWEGEAVDVKEALEYACDDMGYLDRDVRVATVVRVG